MLSLTALLAMATGAKAQEAYAVYDSDSKVVTFYYDTQRASRENTVNINNSFVFSHPYTKAEKAVFDPTFAAYRPTSTAYWFFICGWLESIEGLQHLNTEDVTDMSYMFAQCNNIKKLDLRSLNTAKVKNMDSMFWTCVKLEELDVSGFDTRSLTNMRKMFFDCDALTTLDLRNFNTSNVTIMTSAFYGMDNLTSINVSSFDTSKVTTMECMFADNRKLASLDVSNFDTRNVTNMNGMFQYCEKLESLDLSNFNTENVTDMEEMFYLCKSLTTLDLRNFNTHKVTTMRSMFSYCYELASLNVTSFNTEKVTDMRGMFEDCDIKMKSLDLSSFNTRNVTGMSGMFSGSGRDDAELTTIYVSEGWTTDKMESGDVSVFWRNWNLVGELGTSYLNMYNTNYSNCEDIIYARIDKIGEPGYLTYKAYNAPGPIVLSGNSDGADNYWATYYNNVAGFVADKNTTVYTAKVSDDKTKVVLTEVPDKSVPTAETVILKSTEEEMTLTYKRDITDVLPDNDLKGSGFDIDTPENTYMLAKGVKGVGFYHWTGSTIPAHRGYLTISGAAASRFLGFDDGTEDTTAIKGAQTEGIGDSPLYDLTGRRVEGQPQKGIYVKDGKKVFVK